MYLDVPTWRTLRTQARGGLPGARRFFVASQLAFMAARALIATGRRLDDALYPAYAREPIVAPLFIYATPRSGTTLLHRLLACDEERFTHVRLYQTLLQSVTLTRAVEAVGALDRPLGGVLSRLVEHADARLFGAWRDIHPMGLTQAEEDEGYFIFSLLSPGAFVFYPWVLELDRAAWLDRVEDAARRAVMSDYASGIRRHLFAAGGGRTWLNKTVLLASRMDAVLDAFPDARFVYVVRTPYETVPSFVSMFTTYWRRFYPTLPLNDVEVQALAALVIEYTRRGEELRRRVSPDQLCVVRYTDLIADPRGVVEQVYRHFGFSLTAAYARRLDAEVQATAGYRPRHRYSLAEYGLKQQSIYEALAEVFAAHGFEAQPAVAPTATVPPPDRGG